MFLIFLLHIFSLNVTEKRFTDADRVADYAWEKHCGGKYKLHHPRRTCVWLFQLLQKTTAKYFFINVNK